MRGLVKIAIISMIALVFCLPNGSSVTIIVDDDWAGADYSKIGDAMNNSIDGDTIYVHEGTYDNEGQAVWEYNSVNIIGNGSAYCTVTQCIFLMADWVNLSGLKIECTDDTWLTLGIYVLGSNNTVFENECCEFNDEGFGIYATTDPGYAYSNVIRDNSFYNNTYGMAIRNETDTIISNNSVFNNSYGILLYNTTYNVISNNSIYNNSIGIGITDNTYNSTIKHNEIFNNWNWSIFMAEATENNEVHHNNFANNGNHTSQASDNGTNNVWDDGVSEGNYWDDWGGTGTYSIDGSAGAEDRYPLMDPGNTSAPEKVPEFGFIVPIVVMFTIFALIRKKEYLN